MEWLNISGNPLQMWRRQTGILEIQTCLQLMWRIQLLVLFPALLSLLWQHLQKMLIWSMKPNNFQTANKASLFRFFSSIFCLFSNLTDTALFHFLHHSQLLNLYQRPHVFYSVQLQKQSFISLNLTSCPKKTKTKPNKPWYLAWTDVLPSTALKAAPFPPDILMLVVAKRYIFCFCFIKPKNIFLNFTSQTVGAFYVGWMACLLCNHYSKCSALVL